MPAVTSYKVGTTRAVRGGSVRWLTLHLAKAEDGVKEVSVFFHEGKTGDLGFVNEKTGFVNVNLPLADFEPIYHIIQTEKPIFVHWRCDPEEQRLAGFDVSTSEEPVGEGTHDTSP
jgi:hypothetical protein